MDVKIFNNLDGGEIEENSGVIAMDDGFSSSVYLSLFGGDEDGEWWGNNKEIELISKTQITLKSLPAIPSNLNKIKDAILYDLAWVISDKIADKISVALSMPALNSIIIQIYINGVLFEYSEGWN